MTCIHIPRSVSNANVLYKTGMMSLQDRCFFSSPRTWNRLVDTPGGHLYKDSLFDNKKLNLRDRTCCVRSIDDITLANHHRNVTMFKIAYSHCSHLFEVPAIIKHRISHDDRSNRHDCVFPLFLSQEAQIETRHPPGFYIWPHVQAALHLSLLFSRHQKL